MGAALALLATAAHGEAPPASALPPGKPEPRAAAAPLDPAPPQPADAASPLPPARPSETSGESDRNAQAPDEEEAADLADVESAPPLPRPSPIDALPAEARDAPASEAGTAPGETAPHADADAEAAAVGDPDGAGIAPAADDASSSRAPAAAPAPSPRPDLHAPTRLAARTAPFPRRRPSTIAAQAQAAGSHRAMRPAITPVADPAAESDAAGAPARPAGPAATRRDAFPMDELALVGVFGKPGARRALVRLPDGRVARVRSGDAVDGWRVIAVEPAQLRVSNRSGATRTLTLPPR